MFNLRASVRNWYPVSNGWPKKKPFSQELKVSNKSTVKYLVPLLIFSIDLILGGMLYMLIYRYITCYVTVYPFYCYKIWEHWADSGRVQTKLTLDLFDLPARPTLRRTTAPRTWPRCCTWTRPAWCTPCASATGETSSTRTPGPTSWSSTPWAPRLCTLRRWARV